MKKIIYKSLGCYCITNEQNYNARVQNVREIQVLNDFENPETIIEYYCKYFNCTPDDFIVIE